MTAKDAAEPKRVRDDDRGASRGGRLEPVAPSAKTVDVPTPELQKRLKPLLNKRHRHDARGRGFRDARQFATVAHAAHNTQVPFVVLKHTC